MERSSGILLHLSSLPSKYGVGAISREAYEFVDFLRQAGQSWWQLLPLGETRPDSGDSPYSSVSSFAANPLFIDLAQLERDGLLSDSELRAEDYGADEGTVDYGAVHASRDRLLKKAFARRGFVLKARMEAFRRANAAWLPDYALFSAIGEALARPLPQWPDEIRKRDEAQLVRLQKELANETEYRVFLQYLFFSQYEGLRSYANKNGVRLIGDLPIYCPENSADVWARPELFMLDSQRRPAFVAGVPPDYFSADGQRWGSPLYDWAACQSENYAWWLSRVGMTARLFDATRFDHFRGLESFWCIPASEPTAAGGHWEKGPGMDFIERVKESYPQLFVIAEDLGFITDEVRALVRDSGFFSVKVMQFSLSPWDNPASWPENYPESAVAYTGTHDNDTVLSWLQKASPEERAFASQKLILESDSDVEGFIRAGMNTRAQIFITAMQDLLGLGREARMNTPSVPDGNWRWRMKKEQFTPQLAQKLETLTRESGRANCIN